jgi:hypothetical protein
MGTGFGIQIVLDSSISVKNVFVFVVPHLDVLEDILLSFLSGFILARIDQFLFQRSKEAFHQGVIIADPNQALV